MLEQLKSFPGNALAITVIDVFTEADQHYLEKLFAEKRKAGHDQVNLLIKLDEAKIGGTGVKAFFEDSLWAVRNYTHLGHVAVVAHSNVIKALVPLDKLFFQRASKGRLERYFDVSQLDEAMAFVDGKA